MPLELPGQAGNHLESETVAGLINFKSVGKTDALVRYFDAKLPINLMSRYLDGTGAAGIGIFDGIGNQFVDQKAERNRMIGRQHHRIGTAVQRVTLHRASQSFAKLGHEVDELNEADLRPAPKMICLLYTSDAADEEDSVDLGGRRIIKKKK